MLKEERFDIILKKLETDHKVLYEDLAFVLKVSEDTVRRDIESLHQNGLLKKVRGGAISKSKDPLSFGQRSTYANDKKDTIALKAQKFIKSGMTIFMDGGTTICTIARHLPSDITLRIITNNLALIPIIAKFPKIEIIVLGGDYQPELEITSGIDTCLQINNFQSDLYFMGVCAIHHQFGASAIFKTDAEVKRCMTKSSKKVIAVAHENKIANIETFKVTDLDNIDVIITDLPSDDEELKLFRNLGLQIL